MGFMGKAQGWREKRNHNGKEESIITAQVNNVDGIIHALREGV